jgi:hypothetical protein
LTKVFAGTQVSNPETSEYIIEGNIPMISFEDPVNLQVKVLDSRTYNEVRNTTVIFEMSPGAAPPPYGHDKEMYYAEEILKGNIEDPEVQEYIEYLQYLTVASGKSIHKKASFNKKTGFYEATHTFSRFPWGITVYVVDSNGYLHKTHFFGHRSHCKYIDVTNIELVKTYFHQLSYSAQNEDWEAVKQKLSSINDSLTGKHGMYYMLKSHHGEDISIILELMDALEINITIETSSGVVESVNNLLIALQEYEDYFGMIEIITEDSGPTTVVKVRDVVNQKGISDAIVVLQENYNTNEEILNPSIVPFQAPNQGIYHAKISHIPEGIFAQEIGNGKYVFKGSNIAAENTSKRIFVYYEIDRPGIQSKFITKEINVINQ